MTNKINDLLEEFDTLSLDEQEAILEVEKKRVIQRKRQQLVQEVRKAEQEYSTGKFEKEINYVVWKEDKYYVSRCLNVEVSSFGETIDEAVKNLKEAVELYFEGEDKDITFMDSIMLGKEHINA